MTHAEMLKSRREDESRLLRERLKTLIKWWTVGKIKGDACLKHSENRSIFKEFSLLLFTY